MTKHHRRSAPDVRTTSYSAADERAVRRGFAQKLRRCRVPFVDDARALYRFMADPQQPLAKKAVAVAALLYFIVPVDAVPDVAPLVGYLDDAGVVAAACAYLGGELTPYRAER